MFIIKLISILIVIFFPIVIVLYWLYFTKDGRKLRTYLQLLHKADKLKKNNQIYEALKYYNNTIKIAPTPKAISKRDVCKKEIEKLKG